MSSLIESLLERRMRKQNRARRRIERKPVIEVTETEKNDSMEMNVTTAKTVQAETVEKVPTVEQEDYLLTQIDEFRVKAQQLQKLLQKKEEKAKELQQLVTEREGKAQALQQLVVERQDRADGFTRIMEHKIDGLVEQVNVKLDEVKATVDQELAANRKEEEEKFTQFQEQFREDLTTVKTELSEKIHNENVQSYRNMSELVKNVEQRLDKLEVLDKKLKTLKGLSVSILIFTVLNLAGVAVSILMNYGILR